MILNYCVNINYHIFAGMLKIQIATNKSFKIIILFNFPLFKKCSSSPSQFFFFKYLTWLLAEHFYSDVWQTTKKIVNLPYLIHAPQRLFKKIVSAIKYSPPFFKIDFVPSKRDYLMAINCVQKLKMWIYTVQYVFQAQSIIISVINIPYFVFCCFFFK